MCRVKARIALYIGVCLVVHFAATRLVSAEEVLREISWRDLAREGKLSEENIAVSGENLKIENHKSEPTTVTAFVIEAPGITGSRYSVKGTVRYEGVEEKSYLEMLNVFPDGGEYFSRTLDRTGPLGSLEGNSDWRPFVLPFFLNQATEGPVKLTVNVVLGGKGTVWLGPLRLVQYGPEEDPLAIHGQWWSGRSAGLMGGIAGAMLGCLGGLVGWLGSKGKARVFVLGTMRIFKVLGGTSLVLGGVAVATSQPYAVYYPLLLIGVIMVGVAVVTSRNLQKRYEDLELRKMRAMDAT